MVRGRRKTPTTVQKCSTEGASSTNSQSPVQYQKSRGKCKGKQIQTSPPNLITEYFKKITPNSSQENGENLSDLSQDLLVVTDNVCRKVLRDTNYQLGSSDLLNEASNSDQSETIKTETSIPLSPNTALSRLNISSSKKQAKSKSRPRLVTVPETVENAQKTITQFFPIRRSGRKSKKTVLEEKRKEIEEAVLSEREDGLQVKNFEAKGRGVVATKHFAKGEFVVEYAGELISMVEARKREVMYAQNCLIGCYMYYFTYKNNNHCVDATAESGRLGRLLNHSRNGNLVTKTIEVNGIPRLILLAKDDITPGCELTYDYGDRSKQSLQYHPWLAH